MVRYIAIGPVLIITLLALISRKNYSKYKKGADPLWCVSGFLHHRTPPGIKNRVRNMIRKTNVLNVSSLEESVDEFLLKLYHMLLVGIYTASIITVGVSFVPMAEKNLYVIKRPEAGESSVYVDMQLMDTADKKSENFSLEVSPKEYTDEEFEEASNAAKAYIESKILGTNASDDRITENLILPVRDENGVLRISWSSSEPDVISTYGEVSNEKIDSPVTVTLVADIKDDNHSDTYSKDVSVVSDTNMTSSEKAKASILFIEEDSRTDKELVLPHEIEDVNVVRDSGKERRDLSILFLGLIICIIPCYKMFRELREAEEKKKDELEDAYYGFVNRLTIYIGAGLSLRDAMKRAVEKEKCSYLKNEVVFSLNKIASGISESSAYMELGHSLESQEYMRLMSLLSQNLTYGNSNLIRLLDSEVQQSFFIKREHIKKRGEKASEKLLLPTSILLIIVIVIVMYPAFTAM
ncbi:MAG: hypothetical protein J5517_05035 [Eubacterium sp.]|nr:hypothetical protein [Eubacterium sp.]